MTNPTPAAILARLSESEYPSARRAARTFRTVIRATKTGDRRALNRAIDRLDRAGHGTGAIPPDAINTLDALTWAQEYAHGWRADSVIVFFRPRA
jgi:hypothetical protein